MACAIHILGPALPLDHWEDSCVNIDEATRQAVNKGRLDASRGTFCRLMDILTS
jgi:hypothetical protein